MDLLGAGFSILRNSVPDLRETLDFFRMEYQPSGYKGFDPLADYAGQKYLFALKLASFEAIRESPLRFVELHAGYYTRGFTNSVWTRSATSTLALVSICKSCYSARRP
jgi:hypothetical protein